MIKWRMQRLQRSEYGKNVAWLVSGNVLAHSITLVTMPLLSRFYSPSDFALLSLFTTGVGFMTLLASLRYEYMVPLPSGNADGWRICHLVLRIGSIVTVLTTPIALAFREKFATWAGAPELAIWIPLIPVTGALVSLGVAAQGWIQRQGDFRKSGTAEAIEKGARNAFPFTWRIGFQGSSGLIIGSIVGIASKVLYIFQNSTIDLVHSTGDLKRVMRTYSKLCGSLFISHLLLAGTGAMPVVFIAKYYNQDTLGQYAMANTIIALPSVLLGTAVGSAFYQRAAGQWSNGECLLNLWKNTARNLIIIGIPAYMGLLWILPHVVPLIFGIRWEQAGAFASLLSISAFFSFATSPMDRTCLVVGVWWYIPLWHSLRLATTALIVWVSAYFSFEISRFILLLIIQQSVLYLLDFWAQWRFAQRLPETTKGNSQ